jgi:hypothetical protein
LLLPFFFAFVFVCVSLPLFRDTAAMMVLLYRSIASNGRRAGRQTARLGHHRPPQTDERAFPEASPLCPLLGISSTAFRKKKKFHYARARPNRPNDTDQA